MVKSVCLEHGISDCIDSYYKENNVIGLITGKLIEEKFMVTRIIRTPPKVCDTATCDEVDCADLTITSGLSKSSDVPGCGDSLDHDIDESWVTTHANQVLRMLTGGIDIIGIFIMSDKKSLSESVPKIRKILCNITKRLKISPDMLNMQICRQTKTISYFNYNASVLQSPFIPLMYKKSEFHIRHWHFLQTTLSIDLPIYTPHCNLSQSLSKQIQLGLDSFAKTLTKSTAFIDKILLPSSYLEAPLSTLRQNYVSAQSCSPHKAKKEKNKNLAMGDMFSVELVYLDPCPDLHEDYDTIKAGACIYIRGEIQCRASVHSKASVEEGLKALKTDIMRSLRSRCDLLCEDLLQSEELQDKKVFYEMPVRVFISSRDSSTGQFSDYMFQDECEEYLLKRICDLLDCHGITHHELITDLERIPKKEDFQEKEGFLVEKENNEIYGEVIADSNMSVYFFSALVVAMLSIVIFLFTYIYQSYIVSKRR